MKTAWRVVLLLLVLPGAYAQRQQLDVLGFQPPAAGGAAWTETRSKDYVLYTAINQQRGTFAQIAVYVSRASGGNPPQDFQDEWLDLVEKHGKVNRRPAPAPQDAGGGWQVLQGEARVTGGSGEYTCRLTVYVGGGRVTSVVANYSDPAYLSEIQKVLASVQPVKLAAAAAPAAASSSGAPKTAGARPELWMGLKAGAWNQSASGGFFDLAKTQAEWKVVYPDGDYYPYLPNEGLLSFDRGKSKADAEQGASWGKFSFAGGKGRFQSRFEDIAVEAAGPTVLKKTGSVFSYYKSTDVTGLTLQGSWSYIPASEKDPYYGEPGCRPVIYLDKNGAFDDRGIFVSDCSNPGRSPEDAPGTGRYRIQDYTLVLEYAGGRRRQVAFCGAMDKNPASANEVLYIGGNPFFKRTP